MTEKELIQGCIKQDRRSQNELYKRYFPLMSSIAMRYCNNREQALEGLNFGFLKVLQNISKYNNKYALATWIRNVLVNHLIDEFRKNKKYITQVHLSDFEHYNGNVDVNVGEQDLEEKELRAVLDKLPPVTRNVFNMFAIDGYKHREISQQLGISEGTSKWHVNDARKKLKPLIEQLYRRQTTVRAGQ